MVRWGQFVSVAPELASFGAARLEALPAYLATVRDDGRPRVHPVTPIVTADGLYVFMEPTSPKGRDLRERGWYFLHNGVPDANGSGGEFFLSGRGLAVDDPAVRAVVTGASSYAPADRYVLFELEVEEARCNGYGDVTLPEPSNWWS
jgi:Pyridoxamine 5'-phosphate oxidase